MPHLPNDAANEPRADSQAEASSATQPLIMEPPAPDSLIGQAPRMMRGAIIASHAALIVATAVAGIVAGRNALITTVLAGLTVSVLLIAGQYLQMLLVQRADLAAMAASLAGFGIRVLALGGALTLWLANADRYPTIVPWAVVLGCCAVMLAWLAGILFTYSRLRIPIYDAATTRPEQQNSGETGVSR